VKSGSVTVGRSVARDGLMRCALLARAGARSRPGRRRLARHARAIAATP
jgi:hypothetical protein